MLLVLRVQHSLAHLRLAHSVLVLWLPDERRFDNR